MKALDWRARWVAVRPAATVVIGAVMIATGAANLPINLAMPSAVPAYDVGYRSWIAPLLPVIAIAVMAMVVMVKAPSNPVGWLLGGLVIGFNFSGFASGYLYHSLYVPDMPQWLLAPIVLTSAALPIPSLFIQLLLLFPDGHLPSRRWLPVAWLNVVLGLIGGVASVTDSNAISDGHRTVHNPLAMGWTGLIGNLGTFSFELGIALVAAGLVSLILRYRRADPEPRQQLKWFGYGVVVLLIGLAAASATAPSSAWASPAPVFFETVAFSALPLCIAIAILRYRLYDIDVVINRTLVYGSLAVFIGAVYVGIAVGVGSLVGSGGKPNLGLSIIATAVVAVGFQPLQERLQRLANRLVYGRRASPYEVLSEFSSHVAESYASEEVLSRMARVLAEGTSSERSEVWLRQGDQMVSAAVWPAAEPSSDPLPVTGQVMPAMAAQRPAAVRHQGELLGALTVNKRKGESLTPIEEKLLEDLAHQAGLVLKNVGLTEDLKARLVELRASRQRLVAAQDQERRRLERNLHDGAQQHLVAIKVKLGLAEAQLDKDPAAAIPTLGQLKAAAQDALETLRDLARGIYPPLLAEQGLASALEAQARRASLPVRVVSDGVGRYPQEVESAVYFSCLEALQNVQKYAMAGQATVHLAQNDGHLEFEVRDDGKGFDPASVSRGSGLANIEDRLDALGGALKIESAPDMGTTIIGRVAVQA